MEYKRTKHIPASKIEETFHISNCIDCGEPILQKNVSEYEDQYGCISTIRCSNCNNLTKTQTSIEFCIKEWNSKNDIPIVIDNKSKQISELKQEISLLKTLQKARTKNDKSRLTLTQQRQNTL